MEREREGEREVESTKRRATMEPPDPRCDQERKGAKRERDRYGRERERLHRARSSPFRAGPSGRLSISLSLSLSLSLSFDRSLARSLAFRVTLSREPQCQ